MDVSAGGDGRESVWAGRLVSRLVLCPPEDWGPGDWVQRGKRSFPRDIALCRMPQDAGLDYVGGGEQSVGLVGVEASQAGGHYTMTNAVTELIGKGLQAVESDWRISAGMVAAGVLIGIGKWVWNKRKQKGRKK